jgi:CRP-like cAMP-binding protein
MLMTDIIDEQILHKHIIKSLGKNNNNIEVIPYFTRISVEKNIQLLQQGNVCEYIYFIGKGALQIYTQDNKLIETTKAIVTKHNWCSSFMSFGSGFPATENIRTVEYCELFLIDRQSFKMVMQKVPIFQEYYLQILEESYINK